MTCADVREHSACKPLHRDEAHVGLTAFVGQREVALVGYVAEGELERLKPAGGYALLGDVDPVGGDADVPYPAALLRFQRGGVCAVRVVRVGDFSDLMELEEVDVVGLHHAEAVLDVLEYGLLVARGALGGYDYLVAHVGERETDLLFAVAVSVCGVEIVYPAVIGCAEKLNGGLVIAALNGETAHSCLRDHESGPSKAYLLHGCQLLDLI